MAPTASHFCFSFTFVLLPLYVVAQTRGTIPVGASLTANNDNSTWLSPSGDFALGFRSLDSDIFLMCIWYANIPDRTIAWYGATPLGGTNPTEWIDDGITAPRGSKLAVTADEGLVLTDPAGTKLWRPPMNTGITSYASLSDFGNLAFISTKNETLWQSLDHPRDTLLPTATIVGGGGGGLTSRLSESKFTRGRFQLRFLSDGSLVLNTRNMFTNASYDSTVYYNSSSNIGSENRTTGSSYNLTYADSGHMYILGSDGFKLELTPNDIVPATSYYHRATLDFDGVLTWYYYPRISNGSGNTSWSVTESQPANICVSIRGDYDSGACGFNSICSLSNDGRPMCHCPPNYSLIDANDSYGSCKPDFNPACGEGGGYRLVELDQTDWPTSDYDRLDFVDVEQCKKSCMEDCFCAVSIFRDNTCWKKKLPLSNGRKDSTEGSRAFLKVKDAGDDSPQGPLSPIQNIKINRTSFGNVLSALFGTSVFLNLLMFVIICLGGFYAYHRQPKQDYGIPNQATAEYNVHCFSYGELEEATDGFSQELGRGAFGIVYEGVIGNSHTRTQTSVAVKKLDRLDGEREFRTEVNVIGQTHHKNLVRLIGFCDEGQHRLLVYEFMSNGTLSDFLFGEFKPSWAQRIKIAEGIAAGLAYLHEECKTQIIHCDIKPQNILLDEYHNPRISDFGLAKLLMLDQSHTHTAIRGTKGYVAFEWFRNKPVTAKVDVFSFGVLLLEIICCRKSVMLDMNGGDERAILTDWAFDCYQSRALDALVDNDLEALEDTQTLKRFVAVALWCVQEEPNLRPTMRKVTQMFEGLVMVSAPPPPDSSSISIDVS